MRRPRFGRRTKWGLTVAAVVLAAAIPATWSMLLAYDNGTCVAGIAFAGVGFSRYDTSEFPHRAGWQVSGVVYGAPLGTRLIPALWAEGPEYGLHVPLWIPALAAAIPATLLWRRDLRRTRLARTGSCVRCGYDLGGLPRPDSGGIACPECGSVNRGAGGCAPSDG